MTLLQENTAEIENEKVAENSRSESVVDETHERNGKRPKIDIEEKDDVRFDTIGCICVDGLGRIAAGVSSGGISVKFPGRVGEAAVYGSGCWAEISRRFQGQDADIEEISVACSATGTGEQIMATMLSSKCAEYLLNMENADEAVHTLFEKFLDKEKAQVKFGGIVAIKSILRRDSNLAENSAITGASEANMNISNKVLEVECVWAHTTESMGVGFMSNLSKPKVFISRLANGATPGACVQLSSACFSLK